MKFKISKIRENVKLQAFAGMTIILFIFKIFFYTNDSIVIEIINEIFVGLTAITLISYMIDFVHSRRINALSLVMNIGILNAVTILLLSFSDSIFISLFAGKSGQLDYSGFIYGFASFLFSFIVLTCVALMFVSFRELFFRAQKKLVNKYFNTMMVFFALASFTMFLNSWKDLEFISQTFFIISIILILKNSVRISWIAFIVKKEKITLLILSVIIAVLFMVNLIRSTEGNAHYQVLANFSPALNQFFKIIMIYGAIYFTVLFFTTLFHIPTAEAFDRKAQEVSSLQYFSKLITQVLDFKELAETITEIGLKVANADATWIVLKDGEEITTSAHKNIGYVDANLLSRFVLDKKLNGDLENTVAFSLTNFEYKSQLSQNYSNIAISPLKSHNEVQGYLFAVKKDQFHFDDEDTSAINTFSDYASVSIENSRLLEESIEKERMEKELDVAREIQRKILPSKNPDYKQLDISSVFIPAFEVGGDYYDFFELDKDKFGFVIADVSGKGISAAFIMAEVKGIFESLSKTVERPKEILIKANQILQRALDRKNFVSAAYGLVDVKKQKLFLSRAGHCPIILVRDKKVENLIPTGIGLGLNFGSSFADSLEEIEIDLREDDIIVLYTDGITEAKNKNLDEFGSKYFEDILIANCEANADTLSQKVIQEVTVFSQNVSQHDDITLVILKWKQKIKIDGEEEWQSLTPQLKS